MPFWTISFSFSDNRSHRRTKKKKDRPGICFNLKLADFLRCFFLAVVQRLFSRREEEEEENLSTSVRIKNRRGRSILLRVYLQSRLRHWQVDSKQELIFFRFFFYSFRSILRRGKKIFMISSSQCQHIHKYWIESSLLILRIGERKIRLEKFFSFVRLASFLTPVKFRFLSSAFVRFRSIELNTTLLAIFVQYSTIRCRDVSRFGRMKSLKEMKISFS